MPDTLELQKVKPQYERVSLREAVVSQGAPATGQTQRRVRATIIAVGPGNKTDKAFYTQECISTGPAFFEGARCFANHLSALDKQIQPERRIEQEIGYWTDVTVEGEKLTGTLNILDGAEQDKYWNRIKGAIEYAKKYPGRNIFGVSIHASGDAKPMQYQGETWMQVFRFADVRSCDFVTWPARNGEFTAILSESEKGEIKTLFGEDLAESMKMESMEKLIPGSDNKTISANISAMMHAGVDQDQAVAVALSKAGRSNQTEADGDTAKIFQTLKDQVGALSKAGAPGSEEVRRIVDKLGTSLKLNKMEEVMDPVTNQPASGAPATDPTADLSDEALHHQAHSLCAESHRKQAEAEADPGKKGHHLKMAERHQKMAESFVHAAPGSSVHVAAPGAPAVPPNPGTPEAEQEAKRQAEARQAEDEAKRQAEARQAGSPLPASESERVAVAKFNDLLISNILEKSGLPKAKQDFARTVLLENETGENRIRGKLSTYIRAELQEANRGGHFGARENGTPGYDGAKPELKATRPRLQALLRKGA